MTSQWQPFREPFHTTVLRNGIIAIVAGAVIAAFGGGLARWPPATLLVLWPSFGGHWIELWFLNWLRPRLSPARGAQVVARIGTWFMGGIGLAIGIRLTAMIFARFLPTHWPALWLGGLSFIGIELLAHLTLTLRGQPSFYNGRG